MKSWSMTLPAILLLATSAAAAPSVAIHWGTCPIPANASQNRNAGSGPIEIVTVTAKGLSGPVLGTQVKITLRSNGGLAQAWRYDAGGCEAGRLGVGSGAPGDPCPPLQGANVRHAEQVSYNPLTGIEQIVFAQAYDAFNADPAQVYTIARFEFDHSPPDPCACLETPVCIGLEFATYLDGAMAETNFALENGFLTWNDPTNSMHCPAGVFAVGTGECAPTPVHAGSWGSVKASYR